MSKKLSRDQILHLAKLSRLQLTDSEIEKYEKQMSETLDYVKNLDELDTSSVTETSQTTNLQNVTFEDGEKSKRIIKKDGYFIAKKVL